MSTPDMSGGGWAWKYQGAHDHMNAFIMTQHCVSVNTRRLQSDA